MGSNVLKLLMKLDLTPGNFIFERFSNYQRKHNLKINVISKFCIFIHPWRSAGKEREATD
jgi:hypothetical protein